MVVGNVILGSAAALGSSALRSSGVGGGSKAVGIGVGFVTDDEYASTRLLFGLIMTGVGLGLTAIGLMFQKFALTQGQVQQQKDQKDLARQTSHDSQGSGQAGAEGAGGGGAYFCSKWWMIGFGIFCLGNLLFWFGIALVPQVLLACWQCWAMIVTIFAAPFLLGENVTVWKLGSVIIIMIGIIWVVIASPQNYEAYTTDTFWKAVENHYFLGLTAGVIIAFVFLVGSIYFCKMRRRMSSLRYIMIAVMINWYSVLCAKTSSGFFITTVYHEKSQVNSPEFWLLLVGMLSLAITNVHFLNRALEVGEAVFVVPVYESLAILGQIVFAGIFFDEFRGLGGIAGIELACAVALVLLGVVGASTKEPDNSKFLRKVIVSPETCSCFGKRGFLHAEDDEITPSFVPDTPDAAAGWRQPKSTPDAAAGWRQPKYS